MAQTTSLVFNGGVIPSPSPAPAGSGKAKLLKIGEISVVEQEVQVTKKVICDPDSVTTVAPFMEVLTSAKLAELISANSILVLDDGTVQYLMADATVVVEDGTSVCTSVSFLGLSLEDRAKVLYPCTRITDELTLQQVLEVGEPVETGFDLVQAYPEDTEAGTLIDKLMVEDTVQGPDDQTLLGIVQSEDGEGHPKVAINEDNLRNNIDNIYSSIDGIIETIDEMDVDSVPRAYLASTLNQSPGDNVSTRTTIDVFSVTAIEGDCFEFEQTTTIDDTPFGYVWIKPGTYLINAAVTLQWVGNPRGTFVAKVGSVMGENFDFSQEQEIKRNTTKVVTIPNRMKLAVNVTYDAGTPVMGFWIQSMQVVKLAGGMSQTTVAHGLSLKGNGSVEDPLDISEHGLQEAFDYTKDEEYFATKQEIAPLATQTSLQAETARATQRENEIEALFTLPTQEAVDAWLEAHPEATTTVQDHSLTEQKLTSELALKTIKDYVTPEMFGAVGDGVTDDTSAFERMFSAGNNFVIVNTYFISSVTVPDKPVVISGHGKIIVSDSGLVFNSPSKQKKISGIVFELLPSASCALGFYGNVLTSSSNTLCIDGVSVKATAMSNKVGIDLESENEALFENMSFYGCCLKVANSINPSVVNLVCRHSEIGILNVNARQDSAETACGLKVVNATILGCTIGIKAVQVDSIQVSNSMIDYNDYPVVILGTGEPCFTNCFISSRKGLPCIYAAPNNSNQGVYGGNGFSTEGTNYLSLQQCTLIQHADDEYSESMDYSALEIHGGFNHIISNIAIHFCRKSGVELHDVVLSVLSGIKIGSNVRGSKALISYKNGALEDDVSNTYRDFKTSLPIFVHYARTDISAQSYSTSYAGYFVSFASETATTRAIDTTCSQGISHVVVTVNDPTAVVTYSLSGARITFNVSAHSANTTVSFIAYGKATSQAWT